MPPDDPVVDKHKSDVHNCFISVSNKRLLKNSEMFLTCFPDDAGQRWRGHDPVLADVEFLHFVCSCHFDDLDGGLQGPVTPVATHNQD